MRLGVRTVQIFPPPVGQSCHIPVITAALIERYLIDTGVRSILYRPRTSSTYPSYKAFEISPKNRTSSCKDNDAFRSFLTMVGSRIWWNHVCVKMDCKYTRAPRSQATSQALKMVDDMVGKHLSVASSKCRVGKSCSATGQR